MDPVIVAVVVIVLAALSYYAYTQGMIPGLGPAAAPPAAAPAVAPTYTAYLNSDHNGDDLRRVDGGPLAAHDACSADPACLSFNSQGFLKTVAGPVSGDKGAGITYYVKNV